MKKCKLLSLLLVLVLIVTVVPMAMAEEERPVITVMRIGTDRVWTPELESSQKIMDLCGVTFEVTSVENDAMTLAFASGDLADIVTLSNLTFAEYADTGYLLPLNDLLAQYGDTIMKYTTQYALDLCTIDGEILALPHENNNIKYFTAVRADWLKKQGYDIEAWDLIPESDIRIVSLEEYEKILNDFTNGDPDGNGEKDTFGLGYYTGASVQNAFMPIYGAFGGNMDQYYITEDNVCYPFEVSDDYRAALTELNKLWAAGYIDPEIYIQTADQAKSKGMAGKFGSMNTWWSSAYEWIRDGMWDLQPEAEWVHISIVGPDGKVGTKDNGRVTSTVCITSSCKDPELAMKVLNTLHTDECWWLIRYGVEGEDYLVDENGQYIDRTEKGAELFQSMKLDCLYTLANRIDAENMVNAIMPTDEKMIIRHGMLLHQFVEAAPLYHDAMYGLAAPQEYNDFGVDVKACVEKYNMQFVTGQLELNDANWEAYIKAWKNAGGTDILAAYVAEYNEKNKTEITPIF